MLDKQIYFGDHDHENKFSLTTEVLEVAPWVPCKGRGIRLCQKWERTKSASIFIYNKPIGGLPYLIETRFGWRTVKKHFKLMELS